MLFIENAPFFISVFYCFCIVCAETLQIQHLNGCISERLSNYRPGHCGGTDAAECSCVGFIQTAAAARGHHYMRASLGCFLGSHLQPEILRFVGNVCRKHAPGLASPGLNLITVMNLETAGWTAPDAAKHAWLVTRPRPDNHGRLIEHGNYWDDGCEQRSVACSKVRHSLR